MVKKKITLRILIITMSLFFIGGLYLNSNYFIGTQQWKHRDGGSVGDWIDFDNDIYSIKNRTVFKKTLQQLK